MTVESAASECRADDFDSSGGFVVPADVSAFQDHLTRILNWSMLSETFAHVMIALSGTFHSEVV